MVETDDTDSALGVFRGRGKFLVDDVEGIGSVGVHDIFSLLLDDLTVSWFVEGVKKTIFTLRGR